MDRDYSMETERELCFCTGQVNNNDVELALVYTSTYVNDQEYTVFDYRLSNQLAEYKYVGSLIATCFCNVRQYDSSYTIAAGNSMILSLENYKNELQSICDCLSVPNIGCTAADINYNLGRYGDSLLYNSIFDDGGRYASVVAANGFNEVILNSDSASAAEYLYNRIIIVNSDGNVDYDMDVLLEVMARSAVDITEAEYAAIAMAHLYMDDTDMTEFIKACMVESEKCIGDYKVWEPDALKCSNISAGIYEIEQSTLYIAYSAEQIFLQNRTSANQEIADQLLSLRCSFSQKNVLFQSLNNISPILGGEDDSFPDIKIQAVNQDDNKTDYSVDYKTLSGKIELNNSTGIGYGNIYVKSCVSGKEEVESAVNSARDTFNNTFCEGFDTDGLASVEDYCNFQLSHIKEFVGSMCKNTILGSVIDKVNIDAQSKQALGLIGDILEYVPNLIDDYNQGVENAQIIEQQITNIQNCLTYETFGCEFIWVTYDSIVEQNTTSYVTVGAYTLDSIYAFNEIYPDQATTTEELLNDIDSLTAKITKIIKDGRGDGLTEVSRAGGRY